MHDSQIKWKYTLPYETTAVSNVESYFRVILPDDYKQLLPEINSAKPTKSRFDIQGRTECVLDYMHDIAKVIPASSATSHDDFINIASDPFGNQIGYRIFDGQVSTVYFWDHETDSFTQCAASLSALIDQLY